MRVYLPFVAGRRGESVGGTETILLVDDEPSVRAMTGRILREGGYHVVEAAEAEAAIRLAARIEPALVLTDLVMPGMTGAELAERLRAEDPALKVAFVSAHSDTIFPEGAPATLVEKPFEPDELLFRVRQVLDSAPTPSR